MNRIVLFSVSALGILSAFLPWVYYPSIDRSLYGYMGTGVLSSLAFILFFAFSFLGQRKDNSSVLKILALLSALFLCYISYTTFDAFAQEKENFHAKSQAIAKVAAGFRLGKGVYLLAICSGLSLIYALYAFIGRSQRSVSALMLTASLTLIGCNSYDISSTQKNLLNKEIEASVSAMNEALVQKDYAVYMDYLHPHAVEYIGGKKKLSEYLEAAYQYADSEGTGLSGMTGFEVLDISKDGRNYRTTIKQNVVFQKDNTSYDQEQLLIGLRSTNQKWKYIDISNLSSTHMEDLIKIIPQLKNYIHNHQIN